MKKNILYPLLAAFAGILIGWFIFGTSGSSNTADMHEHKEEVEQFWTCSMHPQIMQNEPGSCPICGMDLIPADSDHEGLGLNEIRMTENAVALAGIETLTVGGEQNKLSEGIRLSGKIQVNENAEAVQAAYFDGRLEGLNIKFEGAEVRKGQLLATVYAPQLVAAQQELLTAARLKASQPELYKAVRNKLRLWKLSENQINQIEKSGEIKEFFPLYANVSGVVTKIMVEEGDYVKTGMPILKISALQTVWAVFDAYENQISFFKEGQEVNVSSRAYPTKEFKAEISFVDPVMNTGTRTLEIRAELKNKEGLFKPGMFVEGLIFTNEKTEGDSLIIPEEAVLWTGERSLVYVKNDPEEPVFEMREVKLGNLIEGYYEITSGLKKGEEIVSKGTFTVDAAAQLQGKKSMMNQKDETPATNLSLSAAFQKEFYDVVDTYLVLKDALVASDKATASKKAATMQKLMEKMSEKNKEALKGSWDDLYTQIKRISAGGGLNDQRDAFALISEKIIGILGEFKEPHATLYVQRCPMAFNNSGAFWISSEDEIKNPYYGDAMLGCGEVKKVLFQ